MDGMEVLNPNRTVVPEKTYKNIEHKLPFGPVGPKVEREGLHEWEKFEQIALDVLDELDYIKIDDNGDITVDPGRFSEFSFLDFKKSMRSRVGDTALTNPIFNKYGSNSVSTIVNLFWDREVFISGAEDRGKVPALAIPDSRNQGLSESYLRKTDAAINLWELGRSRMPEFYPTKADGWDSALSTHDFVVGFLVLNHRFGAGVREEISDNEVLMVNYPDGNRRAVSANFFQDWGYTGKPLADKNFQIGATPYEFVLRNCPGLTARGILLPNDFMRQMDVSFGVGVRKVNSGMVWTEGMAFTLGRKFNGMQVYRMSPDLAAVVTEGDDGSQTVEAIFELERFNDPDRNRVPHWTGRDNFRIKKEGVIIYSQDSLKRMLDNNEELARWVDNLSQFLKLSRDLSSVDVDVSSFALKEQVLLIEIFSKYDEGFLLDFAKAYKINGLRALVLSQDALGDIQGFLEIGLNINPLDAQNIFNEVAKINDHIFSILGDGLADDSWAEEAREKAATLVMAALPLSRDEQVNYKPRHIVSELENLMRVELDIGDDGYLKLLKNYADSKPEQKTIYLRQLVTHWKAKMLSEKRKRRVFEHGQQEVVDFYANINDLETKAQETTGSAKHFELAQNFVRQIVSEADGRRVNILDEGSGSGARITRPLAQQFPEANFVGVDLRKDFVPGQENLQFNVGDFTRLDDPDQAYDAIYSVWSPWMDVEGIEGQIQAAIEAHRVLKPGGRIMIEAADLEGEGKSWQETAQEHKRLNPDSPYGTIKANVEGGVGERRFNIFPKEQLLAMLEAVGFSDVELETYMTENNVPRIVVYATKP